MGLLESLGSGVGYVADAIDKPGRAVRGLLAGKAREGLAAIPFSDSLGLTDAKDRTSGRDLTDHYGLTSKHSNSWGSSIAGFGADVLTDPLSWAGAGAAAHSVRALGRGSQAKAAAKSLSGLDLLDTLRKGPSSVPVVRSIEALPSQPLPITTATGKPRVIGDPRDGEKLARAFADPNRTQTPWWKAAEIAHAEGVPLAPIFSNAWNLKGYETGGAAAHYLPKPHAIELNMGFGDGRGRKIWQDREAMDDLVHHNFQENHLSYDHPDHLAFHELGHALHRDTIGLDRFKSSDMLGEFDPTDKAWIAKYVGNYAGKNPAELIAEIYASLRGGRKYDRLDQPALRGMLTQHAGTGLLDKLSNQGLLKGVGMSALAAAYLGQQPENDRQSFPISP